MKIRGKKIRKYSKKEIKNFVKEDKLEPEFVKKIKGNKMVNHQEVILRKMCECVNADYDIMHPKMLIKESEWYLEYSWTSEQENAFHKWMVSYLKDKKGMSKRQAEIEASYFGLNYGWTTKD
jgi:hypothetical protein